MASCDSDTSADSNSSQSRLVGKSQLVSKKSGSSSSLPDSQNSPTTQPKHTTRYIKINSVGSQDSNENLDPESSSSVRDKRLDSDVDAAPSSAEIDRRLQWSDSDVFVADLISRKVTVYSNYLRKEEEECMSLNSGNTTTQNTTPQNTTPQKTTLSSVVSDAIKEESRAGDGRNDTGTEKVVEDLDVKIECGTTRTKEDEQTDLQKLQEQPPSSGAHSSVPSTAATTPRCSRPCTLVIALPVNCY